MEKIAYSITQSLNHSPSLFDAPGTEALALRNMVKLAANRASDYVPGCVCLSVYNQVLNARYLKSYLMDFQQIYNTHPEHTISCKWLIFSADHMQDG